MSTDGSLGLGRSSPSLLMAIAVADASKVEEDEPEHIKLE